MRILPTAFARPPRMLARAGLIWALALFAASNAPMAQASEAIVAVEARVEDAEGTSRLVFDLTQAVDASAFVLADPERVVIDLPEINFQIDPATARRDNSAKTGKPAFKPATLIRTYRFGLLGPGRSRVVIDLNGPARVVRAVSVRIGDGNAARLVVELASASNEAFAAEAEKGMQGQAVATVPAPASLPKNEADEAKALIVLDPGHGGIDAGASGGKGIVEKSLVLEFAKVLATRLEATGQYRVAMTRNGDSFVALGERVQMARDRHAALFISLHADTLAGATGVQGATIYTLAEKASDAEAGRVADKENQADSMAGVIAREEAGGVNDILFDLTRRETRAYSHLFARTLAGVWQAGGRLNKNPQRAAGFRVLRAPDVPSVLVELGYLSSQRDVADLVSPQWQDQTAQTIIRSVAAFFKARLEGDAVAPPPALAGLGGASAVPAVANK